MSTATTKKPREILTLRDTSDLLVELNRYIEDHVDEIELNGGALPDDLAVLLDEINASRAERADAIAFKVDEFTGYATTAKATKDRAARRQKVWDNAIAAIKAYALREVERAGGDRIRGTSAVLRIQTNSAPATDVRFDNEQLLAFADASIETAPQMGGITRYEPHPLSRFITVERIATIDRKAIGVAYEARRAELARDVDTLAESDISDFELLEIDGIVATDPAADRAELVARVLDRMRRLYIDHELTDEFPGVTVTRGCHLRID